MSGGRLWDEARDQQLRLLAAKGITAEQIAVRLGDCSRSAVLGRAHRLKIKIGTKNRSRSAKLKEPKPAVAQPKPKHQPGRKMKLVAGVPQVAIGKGPRAANQYDFKARAAQRAASTGLPDHLVSGDAKRPVAEIGVPVSRRLSLFELTDHTCRWPNGDPRSRDFNFCGNEPDLDGPYCPYHNRLAYNLRASTGGLPAERTLA